MDKTPITPNIRSYKTPSSSSDNDSKPRMRVARNARDISRLASSSSSCSLLSSTRDERASNSNGSSSRFLGTPRANPFDSHLSMDRLRMPVLSPSVFSIIQSPSQDKSANFWSLDSQAHLFPAEISDESPWKQETATSVLDPDAENETQEAIDHYFSQQHKIKSPEEMPSAIQRPPLASSSMDMGSPLLKVSSRRSSGSGSRTPAVSAGAKVSRWTQTELILPAILPPELEKMLMQYMRFDDRQDQQPREPTQALEDPGNLSTSTLRRKLFEGLIESSTDEDEEQEQKENVSKADKCNEQEMISICTQNHAPDDQLMSSPIKCQELFSPEQLPLTPISKMARFNKKNPTWSSSPISSKQSKRTSISPVNPLGSPTFSPICPSANSTRLLKDKTNDQIS